MKFSQKILVLPILAFLAFASFFVVGRKLAEDGAMRLADIEDVYFRQIELSMQLALLATETQHQFSLAIANEEALDLEDAAQFREHFLATVDGGMAQPRLNHDELQKLKSTYLKYYGLAYPAAETALEKPFSEYTEADFEGQVVARDQYSLLTAELKQTAEENKQRIDGAFHDGRSQAEHAGQILRLTAGITMVLLIVLSIGVILSLVRPLRSIMNGTEAIAAGDLYQTISYRSSDDLGRLADSFRKMQRSLIADIGRRKNIEAQLRAKEERLALAFDAANDGLWDFRIDTGETYLSPRFFSLLGYEPEDLKLSIETIAALNRPDQQSQITELVRKHLFDGSPLDEEMCLRCKDGQWLWLRAIGRIMEEDTDGKPLRSIGTISDINQRKQAEIQLQQAQRELVDSARGAGMAEIATSVLHNVGNVLNAATTSAGVLSRTLNQSRIGALQRLSGVVRDNKNDFATFVANDTQGQKLPDFLIQLANVLQEEQARLRTELSRLDKSHEHIKEIIALQQDYAGVSGVVEDIHPQTLVDDALQLVGGSFERHHIPVEVKCEPNASLVRVENHLALQIIVNLLKNARDAIKEQESSESPIVRISVRMRKAGSGVSTSEEINAKPDTDVGAGAAAGTAGAGTAADAAAAYSATTRGGTPDSFIEIIVADNGTGIEPELMDQIFNYGFTTKREGHGYGLHGAANTARAMGGSLEAYSSGKNKGAQFVLSLPVAGKQERASL